MKRFSVFLGALALTASPVLAAPEDGVRGVFLEQADGTRIQIATVVIDDGDYAVTMAEEAFTDHFLSMRPFRCLEGPEKHWCHVPYPYDIRRELPEGDLTDLEYDFLFLWKRATEYGINMWNGVYYVLSEEDGRLIGQMHEMDMDILSAPPDAGDLRPVGKADLTEADPDSHWLPMMVIE